MQPILISTSTGHYTPQRGGKSCVSKSKEDACTLDKSLQIE